MSTAALDALAEVGRIDAMLDVAGIASADLISERVASVLRELLRARELLREIAASEPVYTQPRRYHEIQIEIETFGEIRELLAGVES